MHKLSKLITMSLTIPLLLILFFSDRIPYVNVLFTEVMTVLILCLGCSFIFWPIAYRRAVGMVLILLTIVSLFLSFSFAVVFFTIFIVVTPKLSVQPVLFFIQLLRVIGSLCIKRWFWLSSTIGITLGVLLFYSLSFNSYFEGDEWVFFRTYLPRNWWMIQGFTQTFSRDNVHNIHMTPIANMLYVIQYKLFGLHFLPYLLGAILLHILTTVTFGYYIYVISKSKFQAMMGMVLFGFTSTHAQAVTWVVASIYTIQAVLFGFLSQIFLLKSLSSDRYQKYLLLFMLSFVLAFWSKETAIIFFPISVLTYWQVKAPRKKYYHLAIFLLATVFIFSQLYGRRNDVSTIQTGKEDASPWSYQVFDLIEEKKVDLFLFRTVAFSFKTLTQSIIPHTVLIHLSEYLTDMQFPFFNAEKSVRGTTYLSFTQSVPPELMSYAFAFAILVFILSMMPFAKQSPLFRHGSILVVTSIIPIVLITYQFPWWGYTAFIDSRHLYHVIPGMVLLFLSILFTIQKTYQWDPTKFRFFANVFLVFFISYHAISLRTSTHIHQTASDFISRKNIVETILKDVQPVPKKLIIYTKSNKSYYGFGYWMLPFQTAFSHMLPVLFSQPYNPQGYTYPDSFYGQGYMQNSLNGLVTQGYHEDGEYGLGYYLEEVPLIKVLEEKQLPVEMVYAFDYNGDTAQFNNISEDFRTKISDRLQSRLVYSDWQRVSSIEDLFSFQLPANLIVDKTENEYLVRDDSKKILAITVYKSEEFIQFSEFVSKLPENSKRTLQMRSINLDLDTTRVVLRPEADLLTLYTVAGNNDRFYKIQFFDTKQMDLILRTLEFVDQTGELISL